LVTHECNFGHFSFITTEKKFPKFLLYLATLSYFPEMSENAVPFFPGRVWKYKPEFFINWKVSLNMDSSMHALILL